MLGLLALAGLLSVFSGLLGLFGKGRTPGAVPLLPLLEVAVGIGGPAFSFAQEPARAVTGLLLASILILVLLSSTLRVLQGRERRRRRERTEGARLAAHLRYLSMKDDSGPTSPPPRGPGSETPA